MSAPRPLAQWQTAAPLWPRLASDEGVARRLQPAILRFAGPGTVRQLRAVVDQNPADLAHLVARAENGKHPRAGWLPLEQWLKESLKLYQPLQQRTYLLAASLVCRQPGLPDRYERRPTPQERRSLPPEGRRRAAQERCSLVLRRLVARHLSGRVHPLDPATYLELAWIPAAPGEERGQWHPVGLEPVLPSEERIPMLPLPYKEHDQTRRILLGGVPVAREPSYVAGEVKPWDARLSALVAACENDVIRPLAELDTLPPETDTAARSTLALWWLVVLLSNYLPSLWEQVQAAAAHDGEPTGVPLLDRWASTLCAVQAQGTPVLIMQAGAPAVDLRGKVSAAELRELRSSLLTRLGHVHQAPAGMLPDNPHVAKHHTLYILRCVYEQPGTLPVVSAPSRAFELASFHDHQAPRPILPPEMPHLPRRPKTKRLRKARLPGLRAALLQRLRGQQGQPGQQGQQGKPGHPGQQGQPGKPAPGGAPPNPPGNRPGGE